MNRRHHRPDPGAVAILTGTLLATGAGWLPAGPAPDPAAEPAHGSPVQNRATPEGARPMTDPAARALRARQLLDSLRGLLRAPERVEIVSAMCYKVAMDPPDVRHTCAHCGQVTTFARDSEPGRIARALPTIERGLTQLGAAISVDARPLCPRCTPSTAGGLLITCECAGCGQPVPWRVEGQRGLAMVPWLYVQHPASTLDGNQLGIWGDDSARAAALASGARFLHQRWFCPACQAREPLTP